LKLVRAKFHYTSWLGAGSEPVRSQLRTSSEQASVMECGFKGQLPLPCPSVEPRLCSIIQSQAQPAVNAILTAIHQRSALSDIRDAFAVSHL